MLPRKNQIIETITHYRHPLPDRLYTYVPTSQFDVNRLVNGKPYWLLMMTGESKRPKTFIITDWRRAFRPNPTITLDNINQITDFWKPIYQQGIKCVVWTGQLEEAKSPADLVDLLNKVKPITIEQIRKEVAKKGISRDESEILDLFRCYQIQNQITNNLEVPTQICPLSISYFNHLDFETFKTLILTVPKETKISLFDISGKREYLHFVLDYFVHIQDIHIHDMQEILRDEKLLITLKTKKIKITGQWTHKEAAALDKELVAEIKLINVDSLLVSTPTPAVNEIELMNSNVTDKVFSEFLKHATNLKSIIINHCQQITGDFTTELRNLNLIVKIGINTSGISDDQLATFINNCPLLETLDLSNCRNITGSFLNKIQNKNLLKSLSLTNMILDQHHLVKLADFKRLEHLTFNKSQEDFSFLKHIESFPALKSFNSDIPDANKYFALLLSKSPQMRRTLSKLVLPLTESEKKISATIVSEILNQAKNILELDLKDMTYDDLALQGPLNYLTVLKISGAIDKINAMRLLNNSPYLENLSIISFSNILPSNIIKFDKLTKLHVLVPPEDVSGLTSLLQNSQNLRELTISGRLPINSDLLASELAKLEELVIDTPIDIFSLKNILSKTPNLKRLAIKDKVASHTEDYKFDLILPYLEEFSLRLPTIDITVLPETQTEYNCAGALIQCMPNLRHFTVKGEIKSKGILEDDFEFALKNIPSLKKLEVINIEITNGSPSKRKINVQKLSSLLDQVEKPCKINLFGLYSPKYSLFLVNSSINLDKVKELNITTMVIDYSLLEYMTATDFNRRLASILKKTPRLASIFFKQHSELTEDVLNSLLSLVNLVTITFEINVSYDIIDKILKQLPHVVIYVSSYQFISYVCADNFNLDNISRLKCIKSDKSLAFNSPISINKLCRILSHLPDNEELSLHELIIEPVHSKPLPLDKVTKLKIYSWDSPGDNYLILLTQHLFLTNLKELVINTPNISFTQLMTLCKSYPKLEVLEIEIFSRISNNEIYKLTSLFPNIKIKDNRSERIRGYSSELSALSSDTPRAEESPSHDASLHQSIPDLSRLRNPSHLDTRTSDINQHVHARQIFIPKDKGHPAPRDYRLKVYPEMKVSNTEVKYLTKQYPITSIEKSPSKDNLRQLYLKEYHHQTDVYYGQVEIPADHDGWYPLPSLSAQDNLLEFSANHDIAIGYCSTTNLHYVKAKNKVTHSISLNFILKSSIRNFSYEMSYGHRPYINFSQLRFGRDGKLIQNMHYNSIVSQLSHLTFAEKIFVLQEFCKFKPGAAPAISDDPIDKLNALIMHQKGACRHSSWVFKALADSFGIPNRAVENDCHAYIEISPTEPRKTWFRVDLGGAPSTLNLQPMKDILTEQKIETEKPIESKSPGSSDTVPIETKKTQTTQDQIQKDLTQEQAIVIPELASALIDTQFNPKNPFNTWDTLKSNATHFLEYCQDITNMSATLPAGKRNILVIIDEDQIETFHQQMVLHQQSRQHGIRYLHSLAEVNEKEARVISTRLEAIPSELLNFAKIAKSGDIIMSNWSDYRPSYVGYNTMMDNDRQLKSVPISPDATVLVVIDRNQAKEMREDFYSRFRLVSTCPPFPAMIDLKEKLTKTASDTIENFSKAEFFDTDWQSLLLGSIKVSGREFYAQPGLLTQAIIKNKPGLLLQNAPWHSADFRIFMAELLTKRSFSFNGVNYKLPETFNVFSESKELHLQSNKVKLVLPDKPQNDVYLLNTQTYKYFLQKIHCKDDLIYVNPGLIEENTNKTIKICVSENLSDVAWARLISLAEQHHCQLDLTLAPNVTLPEKMVLKPSAEHTIHSNASQVQFIVSNDLEFTEEECLSKDPTALVVSIDCKTTFTDLVENIIKLDSKDSPVAFRSIVGSIGQRLLETEGTIILKGTLSPSLAKELESLFLSPPYIWINGEKRTPKSMLVIISDSNPGLNLAPVDERLYRENTFWQALDKQHSDTRGYEKLKVSYAKFKKNVPAFKPSYAQLRDMAAKIKKGSSDNPFKSYLRLDPEDPALTLAKSFWQKPAKTKNPDVLQRRHDKMLSELALSPYLFIAGPTGVGKSTYILEQLKQHNKKVYVGLDNIEAWLNGTGNQDQILFIDEANLEHAGTLDLLEGLFNQTPGILYKGNFYPLTDKHKVIFAGNYKQFVGREDHPIFKKHGQIFNFKELPDDVLSDRILRPSLKLTPLSNQDNEKIITLVLKIYHHAKKSNHVLTPRNLKTITLRVNQYVSVYHLDAMTATKLAILDEMSMLDKTQRNELKKLLDFKQYNLIKKELYKEIPEQLNQFSVTKSRLKPLRLMDQHFKLREKILTDANFNTLEIPSILFEGPPGIGKSKLALEYLKSHGFSPDHPDSSKRFYVITPTDPEKMEALLIQAFHEGAIVIIDELNSLPLEKLLNQLLSGYDKNGDKAQKKGFLVIGTQNPITFTGRRTLSKAQENRFMKIELKDYPNEELREIIARNYPDLPNKETILEDYFAAKQYAKEHNLMPAPTPRNLFEYLPSHEKKETDVLQTHSVKISRPKVEPFTQPRLFSQPIISVSNNKPTDLCIQDTSRDHKSGNSEVSDIPSVALPVSAPLPIKTTPLETSHAASDSGNQASKFLEHAKNSTIQFIVEISNQIARIDATEYCDDTRKAEKKKIFAELKKYATTYIDQYPSDIIRKWKSNHPEIYEKLKANRREGLFGFFKSASEKFLELHENITRDEKHEREANSTIKFSGERKS